MVRELHAIVNELGGETILGRPVRNEGDLQTAIREGFPQAVVKEIKNAGGFTLNGLAKHSLGDAEAAARWLRPNRALGGNAPLQLIDTEPGARSVENVLGRIAYGGVS